MKYFLIIFSFFIVVNSFAKDNWRPLNYKRYTLETIETCPEIIARIIPEDIDFALLNAAIFYETNREREKHALPQFEYSQKLENVAMGHSADMVKYNFFSHNSRVPGKKTLDDRLKKAGFKNYYAGENIAEYALLEIGEDPYYPPSQFGYFRDMKGDSIYMYTYIGLAREIVKGWMNSPGHRANILNEKFIYMGVGNSLYFDGKGIDKVPRVKTTQNFGKF